MTTGESRLEPTSVVDLSYLQAMHDVFSADMESKGIRVASAILDEKAVPLTFEFNHCAFCKEVRRIKTGIQLCRASDLEGIRRAQEHFERTGQAEPVFYLCGQGLIDFCAPIVIEEDIEGQRREMIVAYFFGGQFRYAGKRKDANLKTPTEPTIDTLTKPAQEADQEHYAQLTAKFNETSYLDQTQFDQLEAAAITFAGILNGVVQRLYDWRRVKILEDFMEGAANVRTVDELFELVIRSLPRMIHARHCSIFTVQRDEPSGCEHLVLRRTSYDELKKHEDSAYYDKGEGLTGWVWEQARSLRLENLQDMSELMSHPGLKWKQKHNDSDEHKGFLCVPMFGRKHEVIGVIRAPHKEPGNFDKYDEIFLNFLAGHLSSVIECQVAQERASAAEQLVDIATTLARARSYFKVLDATLLGSLALFAAEEKKHFVNLLEPDNKHWRVERVAGTLGLSRGFENVCGMRFDIGKGFTGFTIQQREAHISSDLEDCERNGHYIPAVDNGESVISAPLKWGEEVYGAISIVSNRKFGFSREKDLTVLMRLAELSGSAIKEVRIRKARVEKARKLKLNMRRKCLGRVGKLASHITDWVIKIFG